MIAPSVRGRLGAAALLLALGGLLVGCGDDAAAARPADELYEEAYDPPAAVEVLGVRENALRPTIGALYTEPDIEAALDDVGGALEDAGWELKRRGSGKMITLVGTRGDEDLQVEATEGDVHVSLSFTFAAPGEGL